MSHHKKRKYLDTNAAKTVVNSLITSRIDYCNCLLFCAPNYQIKRIQRLQNSAARIITQSSKFCHITPILYDLHWLPVQSRIHYKILLLVFKSLNKLAPEYMSNLLQFYTPGRSLRSVNKEQLVIPNSRLKTFGDNSFQVCAPRLWNQLPIHIRTASSLELFKKLLKTYLFNNHFANTPL